MNHHKNQINHVVDYLTNKIDDINEFYNEIKRLGVLINDSSGCLGKKGINLCKEVKKAFIG